MSTRFASILHSVFAIFLITATLPAFAAATPPAKERGIYISQPTLEDTKRVTYLIGQAKKAGINTFVVDFTRDSKLYDKNIQLVKDAGIRYVARIVIFPGGGTHAQLTSIPYREKKLALMERAIDLGAQEIQMDYIRYASKNRPSDKNAEQVNEVIKWFRSNIQAYNKNIPLQIDVFGITSFHPEKRIGQYPKVFANNVDVICPMVYPSHYEPFRPHSANPYKTVYSSLESLKAQLKDEKPVRIIAFIEAHNYRYPHTPSQKVVYVRQQMKAAEEADIAGWYFWSANNHYDHVFQMLRTNQANQAAKPASVVSNEDAQES